MSVEALHHRWAPFVSRLTLWVLTVAVVALAMQPPPDHGIVTVAEGDARGWVVESPEAGAASPGSDPTDPPPPPSPPPVPVAAPSPTPVPVATPSPTPVPSPTPSPTHAPVSEPPPELAPEPAPAEPDCEFDRHVCRGRELWGNLDRLLPSGWEVRFEPGRRGYLGLADARNRRLTIYMRTSAPDGLLRHVMLHELGHAQDFAHLGGDEQARWMKARDLSGDWAPCSGCDDRGHPAGDWAESFAACVSGDTEHFASRLGPPPNVEQCRLIDELTGP